MSLLALLLLPALLGQDGTHPAGTLQIEPAVAHIGEPVELTLTVQHATGDAPDLPNRDLFAGDDTFVVVRGPERIPEPSEDGLAETHLQWVFFSLVPGEREIATPTVRTVSGFAIEPVPVTLSVRPELLADEDEPRPLVGFHAIEERVALAPGVLPGILIAVLALGVLGVYGWNRGRAHGSFEDIGQSIGARFGELESRLADGEADAREVGYGLTALVREAVDQHLDRSHPGATDEEWLERVLAEERLSSETSEAVQRVLSKCERLKYAGYVPTRFALEEIWGGARTLVEDLSIPEEVL